MMTTIKCASTYDIYYNLTLYNKDKTIKIMFTIYVVIKDNVDIKHYKTFAQNLQ